MTVREWVECVDPDVMLHCLERKLTHRKLRLYAAGCCRRIWPLLSDQRSRRAVEIAERHADALASDAQLIDAAKDAYLAARDARTNRISIIPLGFIGSGNYIAADAAVFAANDEAITIDWLYKPAEAAACVYQSTSNWLPERIAQCQLLRDLIPNPFHSKCYKLPTRYTFDHIIKISQNIYLSAAFSDLPILADALEEVGYTDADVLSHCRSDSEHIRGCWVLDAILGKE